MDYFPNHAGPVMLGGIVVEELEGRMHAVWQGGEKGTG